MDRVGCFECKYEDAGRCRRNPPTIVSFGKPVRDDESYWIVELGWPNVYGYDWCGEYIPKPR